MNTTYLLTGGNVGNRQQYLQESARLIESRCGKITRQSAIYETAAWGKTDQASFLNQVLEVSTHLPADELLEVLLAIEAVIGRTRTEKYGPRTIDIDILLFNHDIMHTKNLIIPHPQMSNRRFVLQPLADLIAGYIHPEINETIAELLKNCKDPLPVKKYSEG